MKIARTLLAFALGLAVTYFFAVLFYTQQVIAKMAGIGAVYSTKQKVDTFAENFIGLWQMIFTIALALAIGFIAAFGVKRIARPLAPIAYPAAGAAAMLVMILAIEQILGGGAGVMGGARDALGLALQALAGFIGGAAFAFARPR